LCRLHFVLVQAQTQAEGFYRKLGFVPVGKPYYEGSFELVDMKTEIYEDTQMLTLQSLENEEQLAQIERLERKSPLWVNAPLYVVAHAYFYREHSDVYCFQLAETVIGIVILGKGKVKLCVHSQNHIALNLITKTQGGNGNGDIS
jgi:hypothetical protein